MNAPLYTLDILRLAAESGSGEPLANPDGVADKRAPLCGSRVQVSVKLDQNGRVAAVATEVQACAFGQAAASLMQREAAGRDLSEIAAARAEFADWLSGTRDDPGRWPGLETLAPARPKTARHGAMLLPFEALEAAVKAALE